MLGMHPYKNPFTPGRMGRTAHACGRPKPPASLSSCPYQAALPANTPKFAAHQWLLLLLPILLATLAQPSAVLIQQLLC